MSCRNCNCPNCQPKIEEIEGKPGRHNDIIKITIGDWEISGEICEGAFQMRLINLLFGISTERHFKLRGDFVE